MAESTKTLEIGISPEDYQALLTSVQLEQISLDSLSATCDRKKLSQSAASVKIESSSDIEQEEGFAHALMHYRLVVMQSEAEVVNIAATFRLTLATQRPLPEEFFYVFQHLNLRASTMPYLRELTASLSGRMELPTLTLPYEVLGIPESPKGVAVEEKAVPKPRAARKVKSITSS